MTGRARFAGGGKRANETVTPEALTGMISRVTGSVTLESGLFMNAEKPAAPTVSV